MTAVSTPLNISCSNLSFEYLCQLCHKLHEPDLGTAAHHVERTQMCPWVWLAELPAPCATYRWSTTYPLYALVISQPRSLVLQWQSILRRSGNLSGHLGVVFPTWLPKEWSWCDWLYTACSSASHHNFWALWSILNKFSRLKDNSCKLPGNKQSSKRKQLHGSFQWDDCSLSSNFIAHYKIYSTQSLYVCLEYEKASSTYHRSCNRNVRQKP